MHLDGHHLHIPQIVPFFIFSEKGAFIDIKCHLGQGGKILRIRRRLELPYWTVARCFLRVVEVPTPIHTEDNGTYEFLKPVSLVHILVSSVKPHRDIHCPFLSFYFTYILINLLGYLLNGGCQQIHPQAIETWSLMFTIRSIS